MSRRTPISGFIAVSLACLAALLPAPSSRAAVTRPNVLVIVTDDQRLAADTMAVMPTTQKIFGARGTSFPNATDSTPLCCPSRSGIFSGRFAHNTGVLTNGDPGEVQAFDEHATIQGYLHDAGYQTAISGKFFNTWPLKQTPPNFDHWATMQGGYFSPQFNVDGHVGSVAGYSTDTIGAEANHWLDDFEANDAAPWFLYVAVHAPHAPYYPDQQYAAAPVGTWTPGPGFAEADKTDKPPWVRWRSYSLHDARALRAAQLRTLMSVDDMVGSIFRHLNLLGESDTIAFFLSDNGYLWGEHGIGDNKRFPYTESVGIPFFLRWPGHVASGSVDDRFAQQIDILPTILAATGVSPALTYPLDGRSLLSTGPPNRILLEYWRSPDAPGIPSWASIRTGAYQYVEWYDDDLTTVSFREYYDLAQDPDQLVNLLHDGDPSNNPKTSALAAQLALDRTCSGSECP